MPKKPKQDEALDGRLLLEFLAENYTRVTFSNKKLVVTLEENGYEYSVIQNSKMLYLGTSMEKAIKALNS